MCLLPFELTRPPQDFAPSSSSDLVRCLFHANDKGIQETKQNSYLHCLPSSVVRLTMIL
jgi:hypothetical protein